MRAHSLTLWVAAVVGAFALFATPAEAGGRKHRHYRDGCDRGGWDDYGYYQRARYYEPRYQRVRYVPAPVYYQRPAFQIGFVFGGGNGYGGCR